jgi:outer membrane protein assembly factor BamD
VHRSLLALAGVLLVGCGSHFKPELYPSPEALFDAAKAAYDRGDCGGATVGFTRLTFELQSRDPRLAEARYFLAECRFRGGEYLEASREFRRVADEFPTHELAPTALMRAGDALAKLWKRPELDPTYGEQALSTYSEVLSRFPNSEAATLTRQKSAVLTDKFALKDLKNGDFYFRIGAYDSAMIYYRSVVSNYTQSKYAATALMKLVQTYRRIGYAEEAAETCDHLHRFYEGLDGLADLCPVPAAQ